MINLNRYLNFVGWVGIIAFFSVLMLAISSTELITPIASGFVILISVVQIQTALRISLSNKAYPEWLRGGIRFYWIYLFGLVILFCALSRIFTVHYLLHSNWSVLIFYILAFYQFWLFNDWNHQLSNAERDMEVGTDEAG